MENAYQPAESSARLGGQLNSLGPKHASADRLRAGWPLVADRLVISIVVSLSQVRTTITTATATTTLEPNRVAKFGWSQI